MLRPVIPFFVVSFFLLFFFSSTVHELSGDVPTILTTGSSGSLHQLIIPLLHSMAQFYPIRTAIEFPDFGHYRRMATLSPEQLSLGN